MPFGRNSNDLASQRDPIEILEIYDPTVPTGRVSLE